MLYCAKARGRYACAVDTLFLTLANFLFINKYKKLKTLSNSQVIIKVFHLNGDFARKIIKMLAPIRLLLHGQNSNAPCMLIGNYSCLHLKSSRQRR